MRVEERRGDLTETVHRVHVAVVDADGVLVARAGDPGLVTFWRSAAKPFQAMPLVADGAAERFDFSDAELALCCASHSSEPGQVEMVRALMLNQPLARDFTTQWKFAATLPPPGGK